MLTILLGLSGIALLFAGGELAVRGSVSLARRLSLPPLLIGIVIVGFMTSMPELLVSLRAVLAGNTGVAVGNVVGSDIVNLLLVLSVAAMISPIVAKRVSARRDALVMIAALVAITAFAGFGMLERWQGLLLIAALALYVVWSYRADSHGATREGALHIADAADAECLPPSEPVWSIVLLLIGGLALLALGATWVVTAATAAARSFGFSQDVIGLTVVSLGTSLPELAAAVASARHGHSELVIGNVIGSNIFNALGILGLCAFVRPLPVEHALLVFDIPVLVALSLALLPVFVGRSGLRRWAGWLMLAVYVGYFALRFLI
jgi:cation:H+ antiporter